MQRAVIRSFTVWPALIVIAVGAIACSAALPTATPAAISAQPTTSAVTTLTVSPAATVTRVPQPYPSITPSGTLTLTLWIADDIAPGATPAGRVLRNQIDAFAADHPLIRLDVVTKKSSGKGGLLDFLLTTRDVMPGRLPDLVALDFSEMQAAAQAGVLRPLDGIAPAEVSADLFPFATVASRYNNQWMAVPFAADVDHLVYNRLVVRKPPQTWEEFTRQRNSLLLPLGGDNAFLLQYYALGAELAGGTNAPALDMTATAQVLSLFKRGHDLGLLPEAVINLKNTDEVWTNFAAGQGAMAQVSASRYMTERGKLPSTAFASIPTGEGKPATIATGWAFAMVTGVPERQVAAARVIQWMVQGERLAPWLRAARLVPATRAAVPLAIDPPDYAAFLSQELETAEPKPPAASFTRQSEAWRSAILGVWKGQVTPEEAARNAAGAR